MENTGDKGTISGALSIVSGALGVIYGVGIAIFMVFFQRIFTNPSFMPGTPQLPEGIFRMMVVIYSGIGFVIILIGILGIVGGIFALIRKHWAVALAGAVAGTITFYPCGIIAVIFVCLGKPEFDVKKPLPDTEATI